MFQNELNEFRNTNSLIIFVVSRTSSLSNVMAGAVVTFRLYILVMYDINCSLRQIYFPNMIDDLNTTFRFCRVNRSVTALVWLGMFARRSFMLVLWYLLQLLTLTTLCIQHVCGIQNILLQIIVE